MEIYKWNTAVISFGDKPQQQNENFPVRTDVKVTPIWIKYRNTKEIGCNI